MNGLNIATWIVVTFLSFPLIVLAVECLAAQFRHRVEPLPPADTRPRCAVLIPAHNEGVNLIPTLQSATAQLAAGDRILVVADNCTDDTAAVARSNGAPAVERTDADRRGKGYALAFGRDALRADPPEVVVVLDADCLLGPDALARLTHAARVRPVQAAYRMAATPDAGPNRHVAAFAFLVKNVVRPLGLKRLGLPCLLTGTGMGFPWAVFRDAPLAHGHIVEDMGLAVDLAVAGHPTTFIPDAEVGGVFPTDETAAGTQRRRWEHGHMSVIRTGVPRLVFAAVRRGRFGLVATALDLVVPPLSALALTVLAAWTGLLVWVLVGGAWEPFAALTAVSGLTATSLALIWWRFGRAVLPAKSLLRIPGYAVRKIRLYADFLVRPQRQWVRTERNPTAPPQGSA